MRESESVDLFFSLKEKPLHVVVKYFSLPNIQTVQFLDLLCDNQAIIHEFSSLFIGELKSSFFIKTGKKLPSSIEKLLI